MARNGSGTYIAPSGNPVVTGTVIQTAWANTLVTDLGNEITASLPRDGQAPMTGALKTSDGTVSAPAVSFNSDPATGVYRPTTATIAASVSGVEQMRIGSGTLTLASGGTAVTNAESITYRAASTGGLTLGTAGGAISNAASLGFVAAGGAITNVGSMTFKTSGGTIVDAETIAFRAASTGGLTLGTAGGPLSNVATINGGGFGNLRNKIMNGDMTIAQRGTSFPALADNIYSLDRWKYAKSGTVVQTISQSTDVPAFGIAATFPNSLSFQTTTADTSIISTDHCLSIQVIEGYNIVDLVGKTFTLSFWVRGAKTGIHCVAFRNSGNDRSYVAEYTISAANTWEKKTITVTGGLPTAGTWNYTNGIGLTVSWAMSAGSNFHTTANTWQTGNYLATSGQVNETDAASNFFIVTGVQLEVGNIATPFEQRPYGLEQMLCFRYFENQISPAALGFPCPSTGGYAARFALPWKVQKRAAPSISWNIGNLNNVASYSTISSNENGINIQVVGSIATNTTFTVDQIVGNSDL